MACLGIRHGGLGDCMIRKPGGERSVRVSGSTRLRSLPVSNLAVKLPPIRGSLTTATPASHAGHRSALALFNGGLDLPTDRSIGSYYSGDDHDDYKYNNDRSTCIESPRAFEKLDEWMTNSVTEIVKNIKHSPLLVQIYADGEVRTDKALAAEEWPRLIERQSSSSSLEGVILVEELEKKNADDDPVDSDRAYGVVVQGKVKGGRDGCKSTCYLLKTSSVNICSHFCLMKVQSFHKSAFSQFSDCWLV